MSTLFLNHFGLLLIFFSVTTIKAQFFNPHVNDFDYLNRIEEAVTSETLDIQNQLMTESKILKNLTESFISSKLRENVYKALEKMERKMPSFSIVPASSNRERPMYGSKYTKQFLDYPDIDADGGNDVLNFAVKLNGLVLKQLLLVPHFFRDTIHKILKENGNKTRLGQSGQRQDLVKEKQEIQNSLVTKAQVFLNRSSDVQVLGLLSLLVPDLVNETSTSDLHHTPSGVNMTNSKSHLVNLIIPQPALDVSDFFKIKNDTNGQSNEIHGTFNQTKKIVRELRRLAFELKDGNETPQDIYGGVHDAYKLIDELNYFQSQLNRR